MKDMCCTAASLLIILRSSPFIVKLSEESELAMPEDTEMEQAIQLFRKLGIPHEIKKRHWELKDYAEIELNGASIVFDTIGNFTFVESHANMRHDHR